MFSCTPSIPIIVPNSLHVAAVTSSDPPPHPRRISVDLGDIGRDPRNLEKAMGEIGGLISAEGGLALSFFAVL